MNQRQQPKEYYDDNNLKHLKSVLKNHLIQ